MTMNPFKMLRSLNAYELCLKQLGIDYLSIPAKLNAFVRDMMFEMHTNMSTFGGESNLQAQMDLGGHLVAFCLLGPKIYRERSGLDGDNIALRKL